MTTALRNDILIYKSLTECNDINIVKQKKKRIIILQQGERTWHLHREEKQRKAERIQVKRMQEEQIQKEEKHLQPGERRTKEKKLILQ